MENEHQEEKIRQRAVNLYENNVTVPEIIKILGRSKAWFYKWLKRYKTRDQNWYKEDSRAPLKITRKIDSQMETLILETREKLVNQPFHQYGPQAIFYELIAQGYQAPPVWAIARILKRYNVVKPQKKVSYQAKGKAYAYEYILCQQMDYVGPRYLHGGQRFYTHNIICQETHFSQVSICKGHGADSACDSLIRFWKKAGIPDFLQMDNEIAFWGSLREPTSLGKVIRLCLLNGVIPVFIPVREPWRNGIIEHFNRTFQSAVLSLKLYSTLEELQEHSNEFCEIHNQTHRYSTQEGMTPIQRMNYLEYPLKLLPDDYKMPKEPIQLEEGEIHIIRFIRSDLKFKIFGLSFQMPKEVQYEYVQGVILTAEHKLKIFNDRSYITEFPFILF